MSPVYILPLVGLAVVGGSYLLSAQVGETPRWWFWRIGFVPFLGLVAAGYIALTAAPIPTDYDPAIHGNPARSDFIAMMLLGAVLPAVYLIAALPTFIIVAVLRRRHRGALKENL